MLGFVLHSNTSWLLFFVLLLATVEFRSSMDGGVCSQEPSMKSSLTLSTKKSVTYPADLQDTPAKPPLYHKQPPALPPKPFSRIPNHSTGRYSGFNPPPPPTPKCGIWSTQQFSFIASDHHLQYLPSTSCDNKVCCCFKSTCVAAHVRRISRLVKSPVGQVNWLLSVIANLSEVA